MSEKTPSIHAQVESITLAFCELAKMLGKNDLLAVSQLATAIHDKGNAATIDAETKEALRELAARLLST
jgi:hypothetical protein